MNKKMKEMRSMSEAQLNERMSQLRMELIKFNTQVATGTSPKSPGQIKQAKKNVARIMTIISEMKAKGAAAETASVSGSKPAAKAGSKPKAGKEPMASKKENTKDKTGGVEKKQ